MSVTINDLANLESASLAVRQDEIPKSNLSGTTADLIRDLHIWRRTHDSTDRSWANFAKLLNKAALVLFSYGHPGKAADVCHHMIDTFELFASRESRRSLLVNVIQPEINIARLTAADGQLSDASEIYDALVSWLCEGRAIDIRQCRLTAEDAVLLTASEPSLSHVVFNASLFDSARMLLSAGRYRELLAQVEELRTQTWVFATPTRALALQEMKVRALCGVEQFDEALGELDALLSSKAVTPATRVALYIVAALACVRAGDAEQAMHIVLWLDEQMRGAEALQEANLGARRSHYLLALALALLERHAEAFEHARLSLDVADRIGDESGVMRSLLLLELIAGAARPLEEGHWCERLRAAAEATDYAFERGLALLQLGSAGRSRSDDRQRAADAAASARAFARVPRMFGQEWLHRALAIADVPELTHADTSRSHLPATARALYEECCLLPAS